MRIGIERFEKAGANEEFAFDLAKRLFGGHLGDYPKRWEIKELQEHFAANAQFLQQEVCKRKNSCNWWINHSRHHISSGIDKA